MPEIYCVKCRKKVTPDELVTGPIRWQSTAGKESLREGWHGKCPSCHTRVKQFKKKDVEAAQPQQSGLNIEPPTQIPQ